MDNQYARHMLRAAVAQICHTVGWNSARDTPLAMLTSFTRNYIHRVTCLMMRYAELNNRSDANLEDLAFAFASLGIDQTQLTEYIENVDPAPLPHEVSVVVIKNPTSDTHVFKP